MQFITTSPLQKNGILALWYLNFPRVHNVVFSQTSPHFLFQHCGIKFSPDTTMWYFPRHQLILWTSWFHCHTPYAYCFRLPCLQYLKIMENYEDGKNAYYKNNISLQIGLSIFNKIYFGWDTFLKRLIQFWFNPSLKLNNWVTLPVAPHYHFETFEWIHQKKKRSSFLIRKRHDISWTLLVSLFGSFKLYLSCHDSDSLFIC